MDIYEKIERIREIQKEAETIAKTTELLAGICMTVNAQTTARCLAIAHNLKNRSDELYKEFHELKNSIEKELRS